MVVLEAPTWRSTISADELQEHRPCSGRSSTHRGSRACGHGSGPQHPPGGRVSEQQPRSPGSGASSRAPAFPRGMVPLGELVGEQEAKTNTETAPFPQGVSYVKRYIFLHVTTSASWEMKRLALLIHRRWWAAADKIQVPFLLALKQSHKLPQIVGGRTVR